MTKYGLLGHHLSHSFSPRLHKEFADYPYDLYEMEKEEIKSLISNDEIGGFNITIPYKIEIMKYCDEISPEAKSIGCVNTVVKNNGKITGYNTDLYGFIYMLRRAGIVVKNRNVLILGDGATSQTVQAGLLQLGASKIVKLSRKGENIFSDYDKFTDFQLIINCTPVGMYPHNLESLVDIFKFPKLEGVVDLIYNPMRSKLILDAIEKNITYTDGLPMLVAQAKQASEYFQNKNIDDDILETTIKKIRKETENIILIGMPGCGKTTIGKKIAKVMNRDFVDIDQEIVKKYGEISEIFQSKGESFFRNLEKEEIRIHSKKTGIVISTGGGAILDMENYPPLKQNGRIYFIERRLKRLATDGRPLSKGGLESIIKMYKERLPQYNKFADKKVKNIRFKETINRILEDYNENTGN